jgi:hypothetical protein
MKRFLMVLALGAAMIGCGDDDGDDDDDTPVDAGRDTGTPAPDSGGPIDSGVRNDGGMDAAMPAVVCGGTTCSAFTNTSGLTFAPVCVKNAANMDVCGLSTAPLGGVDAGYPAALERNAPGVASPTCGAFFDALEPVGSATRGNGRINSTVMALGMNLPISYPGCCTAKGFCSGDTNMAKVTIGTSEMDTNANFGCMESTAFFRASPAAVRMITCNATTGALMLPTDAGVPDAGRTADAGGMDSGL